MRKTLNTTYACAVLALAAGCNSQNGRLEREAIASEAMPAVLAMMREDLNRVPRGVREASATLAPGFAVEDPEQRERELRAVLRRLRRPPRGVPGLMLSPISFLAAVDSGGEVIARDVERSEDHMRGFDLAEVAPIVRQVLEDGRSAYALSTLPSREENDRPSVTILFVSPARQGGETVGAVVAGLPLWRWAQRCSRQLELENAGVEGLIQWVLFARGEELHYHAALPEGLPPLVPDPEQRAAALSASPGGYTGELQMFSRWYGYGIVPVSSVDEELVVVLFRSNP